MPIDIPPPIWATETTYPSGPTAGDVCKVQPSGDLVLPGVKTPAEYSNYNFNQWTTAIRRAFNYVVSVAVGNWSPLVLFAGISGEPTGSVYWTQFGYDTFYGRWLGCCYSFDGTNNHVNVEATYDGGRTWSNVFTSSSSSAISIPVAYAVGNFGNNISVAIASGASTATAHAMAPDASTDTTTTLTGPCTGATCFAVHNTTSTGNFYTYYYNQTAGTFAGYFQYADVTGATWGTEGTALPAAFLSGTNHIGAVISAVGTQGIVTVQSLVCICGATAGTDTAHVMLFQTGAGTIFTDITPAFLSGMVISGVAYSANDGLWGILCNNGGAGQSFLYTSPDLVNWTQVWTTDTTSTVNGLAVIGSVWAFQLYNGISTNILFSGDVASLGASSKWHYASSNLAASSFSPKEGGMFSSGNQMLAASNNGVSVSLQAGFPAISPALPV